MNIYLDIDKTLLFEDSYVRKPAKMLKEFLINALQNHELFWLTTHCNGDSTVPLEYMRRFVPSDVARCLERIHPTTWNISKSEAIDFKYDFLWFDDLLMPSDEQILIKRNKLQSFIKVDLKKYPDFYANYMNL